MFSANGKCLILSDSMAKYVEVGDTTLRAFPGSTIRNINDRIRFGEIKVAGYARILIHVGTNDIYGMVKSGQFRSLTVFDIMDRYNALRNSIRKRNSFAVILFSAILPRVSKFKLFRPYIQGLNFA